LDMAHAAKKDGRVLMLEPGEGAAEGIFGPALRVGLGGVLKEAVERDEQFWS